MYTQLLRNLKNKSYIEFTKIENQNQWIMLSIIRSYSSSRDVRSTISIVHHLDVGKKLISIVNCVNVELRTLESFGHSGACIHSPKKEREQKKLFFVSLHSVQCSLMYIVKCTTLSCTIMWNVDTYLRHHIG